MQEKKNSLIRGGMLVLFIIMSMGIIYLKLYRPMIQDILRYRQDIEELKTETARMKRGSKGMKPLTDEERREWKLARQQIYQKFPPAEVLPKYLTFKNSTSLFYGEGISLQRQVPELFLELARAMLQGGGAQFSLLDVSQPENTLTVPGYGSAVQPLELKETSIVISFSGSFRQIAGFFGQLNKLRRFTKVSKIIIKAENDTLKTSITIKTYHCPEGILTNVST